MTTNARNNATSTLSKMNQAMSHSNEAPNSGNNATKIKPLAEMQQAMVMKSDYETNKNAGDTQKPKPKISHSNNKIKKTMAPPEGSKKSSKK
jgi:hypothetical protein